MAPDPQTTLAWRLGDVLGELKHTFPLHEDPTRWLHSNANEIRDAVNNLPGLDISMDELSDYQKLIYPVSDFVAIAY